MSLAVGNEVHTQLGLATRVGVIVDKIYKVFSSVIFWGHHYKYKYNAVNNAVSEMPGKVVSGNSSHLHFGGQFNLHFRGHA